MKYIIYDDKKVIVGIESNNIQFLEKQVQSRQELNPEVKFHEVQYGEPKQTNYWKVVNGELVQKTSEDSFDIFDNLKRPTPKQVRDEKIQKITVRTAAGNLFNGDEVSQQRMIAALKISEITGQTETSWKLANNEIITITYEELSEALALAGQALSDLIIGN